MKARNDIIDAGIFRRVAGDEAESRDWIPGAGSINWR